MRWDPLKAEDFRRLPALLHQQAKLLKQQSEFAATREEVEELLDQAAVCERQAKDMEALIPDGYYRPWWSGRGFWRR